MSRKNYKVDEVIRILSKKGCIITEGKSKTIKVKGEDVFISPFCVSIHNAKNLGNGSWGKIDFLTRKENYPIGGNFRLVGFYAYKSQF